MATQTKKFTLNKLLTLYRSRPQGLLFLIITLAIWGSISIRWVTEFIEQNHPLTGLITGILLSYGILLALEPLLTRGEELRAHLYLGVQAGLTAIALLFYFDLDFFAILLLPLSGQAVYLFSRRPAAAWIALFLLINLLGQLYNFGWPGALSFFLLYSAAIIFVAAFSRMVTQADRERKRSEELLTELQEAHVHLQLFAGQAEELAVAQERTRLARDLHDSVAQSLYGLTLGAEAAARQLHAGETKQAEDFLRACQAETEQALRETRLIIFELRPLQLRDTGLESALRSRLAAVEGRSGLQTRFICEGLEALPEPFETGLYRIAQEGLNNVLKHALATDVTVTLARCVGGVRLMVADNGRGFDPISAGQSGVGLSSMRERAEQLGGTLTLESHPGSGTRLTVEVPL